MATWDDLAVLERHLELRLSQMGFVRRGPVRITIDVELAEPAGRASGDVELPFAGGI